MGGGGGGGGGDPCTPWTAGPKAGFPSVREVSGTEGVNMVTAVGKGEGDSDLLFPVGVGQVCTCKHAPEITQVRH